MILEREQIISVGELLDDDALHIREYQRPYKWSESSVRDLLMDIESAIHDAEKHNGFRYRIGSILLHVHDGAHDIVDGQQRTITLLIIGLCLNMSFKCGLLSQEFSDKTTQRNMHENAMQIRQWLKQRTDAEKQLLKKAISDILEVVVITVDDYSEAFQLFDSQNSRGKQLDPHDLLKAFHLREMRSDLYEMEHAVTQWESRNPDDIRKLFGTFLFPIIRWSQGVRSYKFSDKDVDVFKGVYEYWTYTYAKRTVKAEPCFQINEPIVAGEGFFLYVDHYLQMKEDIERQLKESSLFEDIKPWVDREQNKGKGVGYSYCIDLFERVLICYYDRFHHFDKMVVYKLFSWAFMIRTEMNYLGFDTINNYAIGAGDHVNRIPMFSRICTSRRHSDIATIKVEVSLKSVDEKWRGLYNLIRKINGYE